MAATEPITGAECLARSLAANGTTHVFFIDAVLRRTLIELGTLGVTRVLGHSEKAVAYMADGYARVAGRPGHLLRAVGRRGEPGVRIAGRVSRPHPGHRVHRPQAAGQQHRNAYQEIPHHPLFSSVTKFSALVDSAAESAAAAAPGLARGDDRHAGPGASGSERPAGGDHRNRNGAEPPVADPAFQLRMPPHRPTPSDDDIERAAAALRGSKRIAIVAGAGAAQSQAGKELLALGRGAGGADRHLARRARHHPDAPSAVDWLRRQLCRAAGQPDRARGRTGAVRRLPHRRPGDAHLAHSGDRYAVRADRHRSGGARPVVSATRSG